MEHILLIIFSFSILMLIIFIFLDNRAVKKSLNPDGKINNSNLAEDNDNSVIECAGKRHPNSSTVAGSHHTDDDSGE